MAMAGVWDMMSVAPTQQQKITTRLERRANKLLAGSRKEDRYIYFSSSTDLLAVYDDDYFDVEEVIKKRELHTHTHAPWPRHKEENALRKSFERWFGAELSWAELSWTEHRVQCASHLSFSIPSSIHPSVPSFSNRPLFSFIKVWLHTDAGLNSVVHSIR